MFSIESLEQMIDLEWKYSSLTTNTILFCLEKWPTWFEIPLKGVPTAVQRELDAQFQEHNELLERMMQRLKALSN